MIRLFIYLLIYALPLLDITTISLLAQQKGWKDITIADGLSQGMIHDMLQDHEGFMWFATQDGLNRYDGYNFKVFTHNPRDPYSLSNNTVMALMEDRKGRLWVATNDGQIHLFDAHTQRFYHCFLVDAHSNDISLNEDPRGCIWVSFNFKLLKISLPSQLKSGFPTLPDFRKDIQIKEIYTTPSNQAIYTIKQNDTQQMWLSKVGGLARIDYQHDRLQFIPISSLPPQSELRSIHITSDGIVWTNAIIDNKNTLTLVKWNGKTAQHYTVPPNTWVIRFDNKGFIWIQQAQKIWKIHCEAIDNVDWATAKPELIVQNEMLMKVYHDRNGNIWLGTNGYGLKKYNPRILDFQNYQTGLSVGFVTQTHSQRIFLQRAYSNQFFELDRNQNKLKPIAGLPVGTFTSSMLEDQQGNFWILENSTGPTQRRLASYSAQFRLLNTYEFPNTDIDYNLWRIFQDYQGNLWFGSRQESLIMFNPKTEKFNTYSFKHVLANNEKTNNGYYYFYQDSHNVLWVGTTIGLLKVAWQNGQPEFQLLKDNNQGVNALPNKYVSSIVADPTDPERYLWISTKGGGIARLDKSSGQFRTFTEEDGLPNPVVYGILADVDKNLWLSTNRGLSKFNPKTFEFRNYNSLDGLQSDEFNTQSFGKAPNGDLLFGGINGLNIVQPKRLSATNALSPIKIVNIKINNRALKPGGKLLTEAIEYTPSLELAHNENNVSLEYAALDLTNPTKNRYRYILEGIDGDWVEAGTNRFANYAQLPPGEYVFKVMGSNSSGIWNSTPTQIRIYIAPPWYQSWWAYSLYFSCIATGLYQVYRFRIRRVRIEEQLLFEQKEAQKLAELDTLKTNFFTNISHEFRTPLTLLLGPLDDLKREFPQHSSLDMMQRNGERLQHLTNQLLDLSKLEAGQLKPEMHPVDIAHIIQLLVSSFNSLAQSRGISLNLSQNHSIVDALFDADKLEKIVVNLLSNALKFTPKGGRVDVVVEYLPPNHPQQMQLQVSDTGIGIATDKLATIFNRFYQIDSSHQRNYEGTGIGLALVKELISVLNGNVSVESKVQQGTTFRVTLPLSPLEAEYRITQKQDEVESKREQTFQINQKPSESTADTEGDNLLLIVDDNTDIRTYIRSIFEHEYRIIEAVNGKEGLEKAITHVPDLIIADLMMPVMDGFTFCKRIKSHEAISHIPVLILTAKASLENRIEGLELGADDYLTKPFNQREIQVRVKNLIQQREILRNKFAQRVVDLKPTEVKVSSLDEAFLQKAKAIVEKHLSDSTFSVEQFAAELNMSQVQVWRKLKALTNQSTSEFIRRHRLHRAANLLLQKSVTVSEAAFLVGFQSLPYFSKSFQEVFGVLPSEYVKSSSK